MMNTLTITLTHGGKVMNRYTSYRLVLLLVVRLPRVKDTRESSGQVCHDGHSMGGIAAATAAALDRDAVAGRISSSLMLLLLSAAVTASASASAAAVVELPSPSMMR